MFVISYATPLYEQEIAILLDGLRRYEIPHEIALIPSMGSWLQHVQYKPVFIKQMLEKHKRPLVWLDADEEIRQYPKLFDQINCDIAACFFQDGIILTGVVYFGYNPTVLAFMDAWIKATVSNPQKTEQDTMQEVLKGFPNLKFYNLPREYCMFDLWTNQTDPVLWSRQRSRIYRGAQH